jgi:response regulator RpfG family c-di-GMP phosphodiesterase
MLIDTSSKLIADTVAADPNLKKELLSMSIANVLLVNDEIEFVEKFGERLRMRNLEIANAFSAKEASKVLKENKMSRSLFWM